MLKRPNPSDSEADILAQQAEFSKQKSSGEFSPAVKIIKETPKIEDSAPKCEESTESEGSRLQIEDTFEEIPEDKTLKIIERLPGTSVSLQTHKPRNNPNKKGRISLFAQKRLQNQPTLEQQEHATNPSSPGILDISSLKIKEHTDNEPMDTTEPSQGFVVTNEEKRGIHEENLATLHNMPKEDILEERENLLSRIDPAFVAFLKAKQNGIINESRAVSIEEQNKMAESVDVEEIEASREVLEHPDLDKWINFDYIEAAKLAWMKDIDIPSLKKGEPYEARFDFDGYLLPFTFPQIDESNRALYHHGEEPGRPGYTLKELFQLCHSNIIQQKIMALNTIANILLLNQTGIYDGILEIPIEQVFFVLRMSLDDNTPNILNASIKGIRNLFANLLDEQCLNNVTNFLNIRQPTMSIDENEDDNTVNDQQLAETNLVKCLLRTRILERIRYIINIVKPSKEAILCCIDILIRLARDSKFIVAQILDCDGLLDGIISNFVPAVVFNVSTTSVYRYPLHQAIYLLKILSYRSKRFALALVNEYKIMERISTYLCNQVFLENARHVCIQSESMDLIFAFMQQGFDYYILSPIVTIFLQILHCHINKTDALTSSYIKQQHLAKLLALIDILMRKSMLSEATRKSMILSHARIKWMTQFSGLENFTSGQLLIGAAVLKVCENYDNTLMITINSKGFGVLSENIKRYSNLLSHHKVHKSSSNLLCLEVASWEALGHVVPILHTGSSFLFLTALAEVVERCQSKEVKLLFLHHPNIKKYITDIHGATHFNLVDNWFTRIESKLILSILQIAIDVRHLNDFSLFYELGVKCIRIFDMSQRSRLKTIFKDLIFNKHFFLHQTLRQSLGTTNPSKSLHEAIGNLNEICKVYLQVLGLNCDEVGDHDNYDLSESIKGSFVPVDWIYSPIILLYSNQHDSRQDKKNLSDEEQIIVTKHCLYWIYIYETFLPQLANLIKPTDRYCRLACTLLGSDNLFLNDKIGTLLETCLRLLIKNDSIDRIDFNKKIEGLNNFQDLYIQLLEQYQGVSYGNTLFGNFVLLPLMQKQDVKYRKTLWSEYAGVVQIFNVTAEQVMFPIEMFLNPVEDDDSLIKCYQQAITTGGIRRQSFLFKIAQHHLNAFFNRMKTECNDSVN